MSCESTLPMLRLTSFILIPPFNSNRDYNVLFREQSGAESPAQIKAFGNPCRVTSASGVRRVGEKRPGRNSIFAPSRWG